MTRITRIISDISVICCFFSNIRVERISRNYFVLSPDEPDEPDACAMYCLVKSGASGDYLSNLLRTLRGVRWKNSYLLLNKLLSPESKTNELLQLPNNHRH